MFNTMFQNVSGRTNSTVAELSKFNMRAANEHYMVKKEDSLEAILLALHLPGDEVAFNFPSLCYIALHCIGLATILLLLYPGEDEPES